MCWKEGQLKALPRMENLKLLCSKKVRLFGGMQLLMPPRMSVKQKFIYCWLNYKIQNKSDSLLIHFSLHYDLISRTLNPGDFINILIKKINTSLGITSYPLSNPRLHLNYDT